jgi:hypothetical protein
VQPKQAPFETDEESNQHSYVRSVMESEQGVETGGGENVEELGLSEGTANPGLEDLGGDDSEDE